MILIKNINFFDYIFLLNTHNTFSLFYWLISTILSRNIVHKYWILLCFLFCFNRILYLFTCLLILTISFLHFKMGLTCYFSLCFKFFYCSFILEMIDSSCESCVDLVNIWCLIWKWLHVETRKEHEIIS